MRQKTDENCSYLRGSILAVMLLALILPSFAEANEIGEGINLGGNMRWRMEVDGRDFNNATNMDETSLLRSRVSLAITSIENTKVFFQIQDSRNLGSNSSGLTNDTNLGVHQAYVKLSDFIARGLSFQAGRFEAPYGRHRLIGNVGWSNVGRTFDGVRLSRSGRSYKADIFWLKVLERNFNKDQRILGAYSMFMEDKLHLFVIYDWDQLKTTPPDFDLARYTFGSFFKHSLPNNIGMMFDAALQTGSQGANDISSWMFAGDFSYKIGTRINKIGFGFDVTSGDDDLGDDEIKSFNNLYYTGHKFRGFMDYFVGTSQRGLMDIIFRGTFKPRKKCTMQIDIHHFQTIQDYVNADGDDTKAIGQEIDITHKYKWEKGLGIQSGLSIFMASDDWFPDADNAYWIYTMITAGF
ncbi:MAG: alginate export family protein [candidate division Zixibacteria bacterium]